MNMFTLLEYIMLITINEYVYIAEYIMLIPINEYVYIARIYHANPNK